MPSFFWGATILKADIQGLQVFLENLAGKFLWGITGNWIHPICKGLKLLLSGRVLQWSI